jgi:hypothetical protein
MKKPMANVLCRGVNFNWKPKHIEDFLTLKLTLVIVCVQSLPDFTKDFVLEMVVSNHGIGAVLM